MTAEYPPAAITALDMTGRGVSSTQRAERLKKDDAADNLKFKFWLGAGISGGFGLIYVAKCIIRNEDP